MTSLDKLVDCEVEIEDRESDLEANYIERETKEEEYANLHAAIATLTRKEQRLINLIYFEGKTIDEVGAMLGVSHQAISKAKKKIIEKIRKFF